MNKIKFITLLLCILFATKAFSQQVIRYQGDVEVGYSFGVNEKGFDKVNLHSTHGVRITPYVFLGAGTGLDCFTNYKYDCPELSLPLYVNSKFYTPITPTSHLFFSINLGYSVGLTEGVKDLGGLLLNPSVGISPKLPNGKVLLVSGGFTLQKWSYKGINVNDQSISLRIGYGF